MAWLVGCAAPCCAVVLRCAGSVGFRPMTDPSVPPFWRHVMGFEREDESRARETGRGEFREMQLETSSG